MPGTSDPPATTFRAADLGWLLPPFALGTVLRLWNVRAQILAGDEMHAVRVALSASVHLGPAPFVLAPCLFALGSLAIARRWRPLGAAEKRPGLAALVTVGAATAAAILGFLLPARASLLALVSAKHEEL